MHEIELLITILIALSVILLFSIGYAFKKAKEENRDTTIALRNGLFLAFAIFAVFIFIYDDIREKKVIKGADDKWCEKHPEECKLHIFPLRY